MLSSPSERPLRRTVLINDTAVANHYGCKVVMEEIRRGCTNYDLRLVHSVSLREDWNKPEHRAELESADLVIVNGEGSVHSGRQYARDLIAVAEFCRRRTIPAAFINGLYQGNDAHMDQLMGQFDLVSVRESRSQAELAHSGISARLVPDMLFGHQTTVSGPTGRSIECLFTDSVNPKATDDLMRFSAATRGGRYITLRMRPVSRFQGLRKSGATQLQKRFGRRAGPIKIYGWDQSTHCRTLRDLEALVAASNLVVTGRFHMACLCLLLGTPLLVFPTNSHKIEGLMEDAGLAHRVITPDRFMTLDRRLFSHWSESESESVGRYLDQAEVALVDLFLALRDLADTHPAGARGRSNRSL